MHSSKHENLWDGSSLVVCIWIYNRIWRSYSMRVKRNTQRQNETPITTKALGEHLSEKVSNQGVVLVLRRKETCTRPMNNTLYLQLLVTGDTTGSSAVRVWRKENTLQQIEVSSAITGNPKD